MCGIAGSIGWPTVVPPEGPSTEMRAALAHRGPDGFGWWQEDGVALLHWRLAVIDPSNAGHQPMTSLDGRFVVSYNGETYDHERLRVDIARELQRRGHPPVWRGHSDTEVIVEGVALWGVDFIAQLNGIFALAVYDRERRRLVLARDRAGVKPLYVHQGRSALLFASEAKFFFRAREYTPGIDPKGLAAFLTYSHCYSGHHVLDGVRQLDPGEVLSCTLGSRDQPPSVARSRLCPRPRWRPVARKDADAAADVRQLLRRVVARQLVADVPVGVLLSGGVDSSVLTALTAEIMGPERTLAFTLGYPGMSADYDEIAAARRVAKHLGVQHHVYEATSSDLIRNLEELVWHYDEPFADAAALNTFLLSRLIRSRVTVALAGEGSDEVFGGYRRYQFEKTFRALGPLARGVSTLARAAHLDRLGWTPRRLQVLLRAVARETAPSRYSSFLESEIAVRTILKPEWHRTVEVNTAIQEGYPDLIDGGTVGRLCVVDQEFWLPTTYLEKSDKGGMAHALEIRVPFLDNEVVEFANTLPDHQRIRGWRRKWLLERAFGDALPREVFQRFKRGFGVPVAPWLRNELREYYLDEVLSPTSRIGKYVQMHALEVAFRDHLRGARDFSGLLWKCLVLEIWLRHYENGFTARPRAEVVLSRDSAPPTYVEA